MRDQVTVTLTRDQFNEVCNLLQLMVVLGVQLHVVGLQPNKRLLSQAFDAFAAAALTPQSGQTLDTTAST